MPTDPGVRPSGARRKFSRSIKSWTAPARSSATIEFPSLPTQLRARTIPAVGRRTTPRPFERLAGLHKNEITLPDIAPGANVSATQLATALKAISPGESQQFDSTKLANDKQVTAGEFAIVAADLLTGASLIGETIADPDSTKNPAVPPIKDVPCKVMP